MEETWVSDENGNRCSSTYFGSVEAAQKALDSLVDCENCTNCSDCTDCTGCLRCSGCTDCSDCSECSRCSGCSDCSGCTHIAKLWDRKNLKGDPDIESNGAPPTPVVADIHQAVYAAATKPKALNMGDWHTCETTHCRAGWVVHLAGEPGYALERFHNTALAAQLIYKASDPENPVSPVRFYETNEQALADMARLAGV